MGWSSHTSLLGCALTAIALAASCSNVEVPSPTADTAPFVSGSRLRAHVYDGGDDARVLIDWQDTALHVSCSFRHAADGALRCLPLEEPSYVHYTESDIFYLDAACIQPVRLVSTRVDTPPPYFIGDPIGDVACAEDVRRFPVFALGEEVAPPTTPLHRMSADGCIADAVLVDPAYMRLYSVGDELDPTELVAAESEVEPRGDRVGARYLVAADGSRELVAIHDLGRDADFALLWFEFREGGPCLPRELAWAVGDFADAACTEPSAYAAPNVPGGFDAGCPAPDIAIVGRLDACGTDDATVVALGPVVDAVYAEDAAGVCAATPPGSGHVDYVLGAPVPDGTYPDLDVSNVGAGRLRERRLASDDGSPLTLRNETASNYPFFDTLLGAECGAQAFCDGTLRCLPSIPSSNPYYADAACTKELVLIGTAPCPGAVPPPIVIKSPSFGTLSCGLEMDSLRRVGPVPSLTAVYASDGAGGCVEALLDQGVGFAYHEVGPVVSPDEFATITERVE